MGGNSEALVMIVAIVFIMALPIGYMYSRYLTKIKKYDVLIRIAELGTKLDPQVLEGLSEKQKTYKDDYLSGIIWTAVGLPVVIGGGIEQGSLSGVILLSIFLCVGIGYFISGKLRLRESDG